MKLDHLLIIYKKINSMDKTLKPEIEKLIEENTSNMLFEISISNTFWICLLREEQKAKISEWHYIKLKTLLLREGKHQ